MLSPPSKAATSKTLRAVALIEAFKGALVLLVGLGLLSLAHHDAQLIAEQWVAHFHLNPGSRYPRIFLNLAYETTSPRLRLIAAGSGIYSLIRFVEAYGLWHYKKWAQWVSAVSGVIYVPFELVELREHASWLGLAALTLNILIVVLMLYFLRHPKRMPSS
jgi:uncharacterized membrane protein (DUF2068 family)